MREIDGSIAENISARAKNLLWTVSGNHDLRLAIDGELFDCSCSRCLYEAAKLGGAEKYIGLDEIMLYALKKGYVGADAGAVQELVSFCLDSAVYSPLASERAGISEMRRMAYDETIDTEFEHLASSPLGRLELAFMQSCTQEGRVFTDTINRPLAKLRSLSGTRTAREVIEIIDELYNEFVDPQFGRKGISLDDVLAVTVEQMAEDGYLRDVSKDAYINDMLRRAADAARREEPPGGEGQGDGEQLRTDPLDMGVENEADESALDRYTEIVFGASALTQAEARQLNSAVCSGLHTGRKVHVTAGLLEAEDAGTKEIVARHADIYHQVADRHRKLNELAYYARHRVVKQNSRKLAAVLKRCLTRRSEPEITRAQFGSLVPGRLWMAGRIRNPKLFDRITRGDDSSFAIDVLVDGSGSQARRQSSVAVQAYIISSALSSAGVAHRVSSYCTMQDRTIIQLFRDFDDPPSADWKIFRYAARGANRDGLAVRGAAHGLAAREEQNKIMIILSDGKPNDIAVRADGGGRTRLSARAAEMLALPYTEETAVDDTAREVRRVRELGIPVLGVFAGAEEDLDAERRIFGKDFAYIRDIITFSEVVGKYLERCMEG